MSTRVQILQLPYDSGNRGLRMGRGPEHFVRNGLVEALESKGHEVSTEIIESGTEFQAEVQTQFELYGLLSEHVAKARQNGKFPLVLSGNCGATLGALAGAETRQIGLIWFDAHGEFNTPETTASGFLDGMGLAIATGQCWKRIAASIPNFSVLPGTNILHIGGRDFDEGERERLEETGATVIDAATIQRSGVNKALTASLSQFVQKVEKVHLHLDLDVLNPKEAVTNQYATGEEGLSVAQVGEGIQSIREHLQITSATVASFDPTYDPNGKTLHAGVKLIIQILDGE